MQEGTRDQNSIERLFANQLFHLGVVSVLSGLLLFSNLNHGGLGGYDDALYAHEGQQMLSTGDWWSVRFNGVFNFEYPPMFIWMEAVSMSIWGVTDFAAKFPAALSGFLTITVVFLLGRRLSDNFWLPVAAAWVLMLTQYFLKYAMHAMTDVPYALFFTLAILFYVIGGDRPAFFLLCGLAVASATLTRSVLGLIPAVIILGHLVLTRRTGLLRSGYFLAGMSLALLLPSIWYVSQYRLHGDPFVTAHLGFVSSKVASSGQFDAGAFLRGLGMYPWSLLNLYWPWLPFMLIGFWGQARRALLARESTAVLLVVWVFGIVVPFSLVDAKVLRYIMPVFPALALLSAMPISLWLTRIHSKRFARVGYSVLCVLVVAIVFFTSSFPRAEEMSQIGSVVETETTPAERVVLYTYGEARHDTRNQLLWYSNRLCDWLLEPAALVQQLEERDRVFVVDRPSYELFVLPAGAEIENLRNTDNWVSFRTL